MSEGGCCIGEKEKKESVIFVQAKELDLALQRLADYVSDLEKRLWPVMSSPENVKGQEVSVIEHPDEICDVAKRFRSCRVFSDSISLTVAGIIVRLEV